MKKIIQVPIAIAIIAAAILMKNFMVNSKKTPEKKKATAYKSVTTEFVKNQILPIQIKSTGSILAKDRTVLYSEVQGVFQKTSKAFKPGVRYSNGQTLISINNTEFSASVKSQRINFKSLITGILADIQFDYPTQLNTWRNYANSISAEQTLPALPKINNENFNNYISGKSIFTNFYSIKNLETRLNKYTLRAPFTGTLVNASITPGTLVSPGQKLGEFIKTGVYELELNVNASLSDFLKIGKKVTLYNNDHTKTYLGTVSRMNAQIDRSTQTVQLFVEVRSNDLNEGEYLEADIEAKNIENVFEINRNLIVDQNSVYVVKENSLAKQQITIVHTNENSIVVSGLVDSTELVTSPVSGAYEGMNIVVKN